MRRRIEYDPITKVDQTFEMHPDGSFTIGDEQDIEPILQHNLDLRNLHDQRAPWTGDMHHVASIPDVIMNDLIRSGMARDEKAMKKWLNDPANLPFRTRPGKV